MASSLATYSHGEISQRTLTLLHKGSLHGTEDIIKEQSEKKAETNRNQDKHAGNLMSSTTDRYSCSGISDRCTRVVVHNRGRYLNIYQVRGQVTCSSRNKR